jgi:hypothetical protein
MIMTEQTLAEELEKAYVTTARLTDERDRARREVERLKGELRMVQGRLAQANGWQQPSRPDWVRKDPGRLEIAVMFLNGPICEDVEMALRWADEIIAAANK